MTSHSSDELDLLIRCTLIDHMRAAQPPPKIWDSIRLRLADCAVGDAGLWGRLMRRFRSLSEEDLLGHTVYPPLTFHNWVNYMQPSLAYIVERYLAILRIGWAT
ncbi:MAG: hypothetical protein N2508_13040 [Anaerolineae bacterium]|nr:hypothetical protein [Anaerolineae bacterium]